MGKAAVDDRWRDGDSYELYVGRWSRRVAETFVAWLGVPPRSRWLDVGCGTGALSSAVLEHADPAAVFGVEPSEAFLQTAARDLGGRVTLARGTAESIPLPDESFDAVVSGLVMNFAQDQPAALAEMSRVAVPGATIAAYVWDYGGQMQFMKYFWSAAAGLNGAAEADEGARFPICNPDALLALFTDSGLTDATVRAIDIPTRFSSFDDYWQPFLGGTGVAPAYLASLDEASWLTIRERLRRNLPMQPDGSISLIARAWAVRARRG
jgi:SAM-dependent methyltransferase